MVGGNKANGIFPALDPCKQNISLFCEGKGREPKSIFVPFWIGDVQTDPLPKNNMAKCVSILSFAIPSMSCNHVAYMLGWASLLSIAHRPSSIEYCTYVSSLSRGALPHYFAQYQPCLSHLWDSPSPLQAPSLFFFYSVRCAGTKPCICPLNGEEQPFGLGNGVWDMGYGIWDMGHEWWVMDVEREGRGEKRREEKALINDNDKDKWTWGKLSANWCNVWTTKHNRNLVHQFKRRGRCTLENKI